MDSEGSAGREGGAPACFGMAKVQVSAGALTNITTVVFGSS